MGKPKFSLENKTAIVTGGASGIGEAISLNFARQGARVIILERNREAGKKIMAQADSEGLNIQLELCDVSDSEQVNEVIADIANDYRIDILVNNAGIAHVGNVENTTPEDLDKLYNVNIKGVYNCLYAVIPYMRSRNYGVVINMASIASTVAVADRFAYSMTKGAVLAMTYSIAKDYIGDGIRCNAISPARIHTPFVDGFIKANYPGKEKEMFKKLAATQPIGRMGMPQEVADLALFLASDEASFITGTEFPIDGGFIKLNG
ncbi:SDR family NAD(P)-dependent oxidoreductase [Robertkochia solimangrovi]|uniref:SDR family NAD(P)-dependent oxidoreductase n=1 Tax=Robertkochia solimangrovi TaxID=2213046 RepID=UPI001180A769|nr:SDR family oxidoreductase [Robertkochia solimangrovi]TRZ42299.1 short-chain dehydrogenase [Robertkochia solimangrovi]